MSMTLTTTLKSRNCGGASSARIKRNTQRWTERPPGAVTAFHIHKTSPVYGVLSAIVSHTNTSCRKGDLTQRRTYVYSHPNLLQTAISWTVVKVRAALVRRIVQSDICVISRNARDPNSA